MTERGPGRSARRRDLVWIALGAAVLFLPFLGARDLWNPSEPLYGRAVVEMARSGNWLAPTVNGEPFAEKPPLYFWLARIVAWPLGGVDELTLRLPSALLALAGTLLVYLLILPYAGRQRAWLGAAIFATTYIVFWSARAIQMDLPLAVCTLGAVLAAVRALDHGASAPLSWSLVGISAGAGFLFKGPVGVICPALVIAGYAASTGRLAELHPRRVAPAVALCLLVAAPWLVALWANGSRDFLRELLLRQNVTRFVEPWDHAGPWWYFLLYFWIDMAPWAWLVPLAAWLPGRDGAERRLDRLAWVWVAVIVLFFSFSASKRSPYILPVAPAVAVLASAVVERARWGGLSEGRTRALRAVLGIFGAAFVAAGGYVALRVVGEYPALDAAARAVALLLVGGGAAVLAGLILARRLPSAAPAALLASVVSLYLLAAAWVLPAADAYKSARPFCERLNATVGTDDPLRSYRFWRWRASYVYYADRRIPRLETPDQLRAYWNRNERVYLLVERWMVDEVRSVVGPIDPVLGDEIGDNAVYLFTNRGSTSREAR